jgi:hypothetical protein
VGVLVARVRVFRCRYGGMRACDCEVLRECAIVRYFACLGEILI